MKIENITIFTAVFLIIILPVLLLFAIKETPGRIQSSLDNTEKIHQDVIVSQEFFSKENNLSNVSMSIKNPNLINKKDLILKLYQDQIEQRTVVVSGKNIEDGNFVKFRFAPIANSKNKFFTFTVESPTSTKNEALEIFYSGSKLPIDKPMQVNHQPTEVEIAYVEFYKPKNIFILIEKVYGAWLNRLSADLPFFVSYIFIILLCLGYLVKPMIFRAKK